MKAILTVAGVFQIEGTGLLVAGQLQKDVRRDDPVAILRKDGSKVITCIVDIKHYDASLDAASAGSNVALVLQGISKSQVAEGDVIAVGMPSPSSFLMRVDDIFLVKGRGIVLTGIVASGAVQTGECVRIVRQNASVLDVTVSGIEHKRALVQNAVAGDSVGILFEGLSFGQINIGDIITGK